MICEQELRNHLTSRAGAYYGDLRGSAVQVRLRSLRQRTNSTLYEFDLTGSDRGYCVLVKGPGPRHAGEAAVVDGTQYADRPRLFAKPLVEHKSRYEFAALSTIEKHFAGTQDERFAVVRTLDLLPDESALVMEKANATSLNWHMLCASRLSLRQADYEALARIFHNAGAWLRRFHQLPSLPHTCSRCTTRAAFVDSIEEFTSYLSDGRPDPWRQLQDTIHNAAAQYLPDSFPLGLSHGDYAPRNVLSEKSGRVSVIDTVARWRAPIYEDLACFINAIKISQPQVWTLGLAYKRCDLEMFEQRFLAGYFADEPHPLTQVRLFECQALLERWAAIVHRSREATGWQRAAKMSRRIVWEAFLKRQLSETLQYLQQDRPA